MQEAVQTTGALYKLISPFYCDDTIFEPGPDGLEIVYDGVPNEGMEPLNELARERMTTYLKGLDDGMVASGRISRKLEDVIFQEMSNRPREQTPNGTVVLPTFQANKPIMGHLDSKGNVKEPGNKPSVRLAALSPDKAAPTVIGKAT